MKEKSSRLLSPEDIKGEPASQKVSGAVGQRITDTNHEYSRLGVRRERRPNPQ